MLKNKFIIFLIGFYVFWLGVLPLILNNTVEFLCNTFLDKGTYSIKIENTQIKLSLIPIIKIKAKNITFIAKDNNKIQINAPDINLRILPLFSGKIHVNTFKADSVNTYISLEKPLELDKNFLNKFKNTKFVCDFISIKHFETQLVQKNIKKPIKHFGNNLLFKRKNHYLKFQMESFLEVGEKKSNSNWNLLIPKNNDINKTIFDVQLSNFDLSNLRAYLKNYLPKDFKELNGIVNIQANKNKLIVEMKKCSAVRDDYAKSIILPEKLIISSIFNINKQFISFNSVNINSKGINVDFEGKIYNYFGKSKPTVDFSVRVNPSKIEEIINLLPSFKIEELDAYKLKKYKFYGDIIANIKIQGRLPEPSINGDVYISNGMLFKPIVNNAKGASIKINLTGRKANFEVIVPINNAERVYVDGTQEIYNIKYADLNVNSTNNVDLKLAKKILVPLHEILNFIIGPVSVMDIEGDGNININVKGNRKNPHIRGLMHINNASAYFMDMPDFIIKNTSAIITFNDQNVQFVTQKAFLNNKLTSIKGFCNLVGKFDFDIESANQPIQSLYKGILTNKFIKEDIPEVEILKGFANFNLKVYGSVKSVKEILLNQNVFIKGIIEVFDNNFMCHGINIDKANGKINVDNQNYDIKIDAKTDNLPLSIKAVLKKNFADFNLDIPKINPNFIFKNKSIRTKQLLPYLSVKAKYKGNINEIEYDKINLDAKVINSDINSKVKFETGELIVANNEIQLNNFDGHIGDVNNTVKFNFKIRNAFSKQPNTNGCIELKSPDLTLLNDVMEGDLFIENINDCLEKFKFDSGAADLNIKIVNNKLNFYTDLSGVKITYLPINLPIEFINGTLAIKNNDLILNKINLIADNMPILTDGSIKDVFGKKYLNIYINSKPKQEFIDKYFNKNQIYPIKIKGDIVYWAKIKGTPDDIDLSTKIDLSKGASIFHLGATVGDIENAITIYQESEIINKNIFKIKEFSYDKIIDSLKGKQTKLNLLKAKGDVNLIKDDILLKDFQIKTSNPTDARIFNIIFRKPNIKQGLFTSDLKINGVLSNPKVLGHFYIFETQIPFFDTTAKNIELTFKDNNIDVFSTGDILGNDFNFNANIKNKITKPYILENGVLRTKNLDINRIINKIKVSEIDNISTFESFEDFELSSIVLNNLKIIAENIELRNIKATDFEAKMKLSKEGIFDVDKFSFNIAQGSLDGRYNHNLKNNDILLNLDINNIDANDITMAVFDLENQIFGDMTGNINLSCNGTNFQHCMQTLNGNSIFNVKNGRMPKLGSLEYLLKAANLLKGGLTGLSINSIIDIITPLKTGEFSDIYGLIRIKDGIARNFEITSKGKNLSLFIAGTYNFSTSFADMQVFGLLSKKLSTLFGPLGNVSINTLFNIIPGIDLSEDSLILEKINKIPGIELSNKTYRKFIADIKGNINNENYVKSFQWVN